MGWACSSDIVGGDDDRDRLGSRSKSRGRAVGGNCIWGMFSLADKRVSETWGDEVCVPKLYNV